MRDAPKRIYLEMQTICPIFRVFLHVFPVIRELHMMLPGFRGLFERRIPRRLRDVPALPRAVDLAVPGRKPLCRSCSARLRFL